MKNAIAVMLAGGAMIASLSASAEPTQPLRLPFTATLSNNTPLAFGMTVEQAAAVLNAPLKYIRGRPGDEVFAVPRPASAGYFVRNDQLFLQFRKGRLTAWKGDWGRNWMWE